MRRFVAVVGIAGLGLAWAAMPASAGTAARFVSTPASGPAGTVIHASSDAARDGSTCDIPGESVHVEIFGPGEVSVATGDTTVTSGLKWSVIVKIPAGSVPGSYDVTASCTDGESSANYIDNGFTVTASVITTTTTVGGPTTTVPTPEVPQATPATPVVASARLTG